MTSDNLAGIKLFVGTPMYDSRCHSTFVFSMVQLSVLCVQVGVELRCFFACNEALISKARNITVDEFIRSDCDYLIFIDSDIGFDARDVIQMLDLQARDTEERAFDVIAAPYPLKRIEWDRVLYAAKRGFADDDPNRLADVSSEVAVAPAHERVFEVGRPLEVSQAGCGFMMIRRETFIRLHEELPRPTYRTSRRGLETKSSENIIAFFETEIDSRRLQMMQEVKNYLLCNPQASSWDTLEFIAKQNEMLQPQGNYISEDYAFCRAVRVAKMQIWLCPWMKLSHSGNHVFTSSLAELAALQQ